MTEDKNQRDISAMSSSDLFVSMTKEQREDIYNMVKSDHVRNDVVELLDTYKGQLPKNADELEVLIEDVVNAYVYDKRYKKNLSYNENLEILINRFA